MVVPIMTDPRERCRGCDKNILTHHRVASCDSCSKLVHAKCSSKVLRYNSINSVWTCLNCISIMPSRYNPFASLCTTNSHRSYEPLSEDSDLQKINDLLNNCDYYNIDKIGELFSNKGKEQNKVVTTLFNNLDGNATNFDSFCTEIANKHHKFSIIALAETNIDEEHGPLYQMEGYHQPLYQSKISGKKKGSGLGIYIEENLEFCEAPQFNHCTENMESLFIQTRNTSEVLTFGVVYRPPSGNESDFLKMFETLLSTLPNKNVTISGDFNIDLHKRCEQFENILYSNGFAPMISIATNEKSGCTPSCIDNIFVNSWDNVSVSGASKNKVSSHNPIFCDIGIEYKPSQNDRKTPRYDTCDSNMEIFMQKLENSMINNINGNIPLTDDIELAFKSFTDDLSELVEECFLINPENSNNSKRTIFVNPWITPGIIASVKTKQYLYENWKKSETETDKLGNYDLYFKYSDFRRKLKFIIRCAKHKYYGNKFEKYNGNMRKTWQLINELRGKVKHKNKPSFKIDGQLVHDKRIISNGFNKYFTSIAENMNQELTDSLHGNEQIENKMFFDKSISSSMFFKPCDESEISEIISDLESGKSSDLPIKVIKQASHFLVPKLTIYFNKFIEKGVFPKNLKVGRVTPIFKKGDAQLFGNYRPVCTLPIFGKIFEKIIFNRLHNFFSSKGIIYDNQFGFRKNHSTSHAINFSVNKILEGINKNKHMLGIFIDLSKAFDTINHDKLLEKLSNYGVRGTCQCLLKSYLSGRSQYTSIFTETSELTLVKYGVPQGSVLGPLLFIIYINDIINSSRDCKFILFADETNIFVAGDTEKDAFDRANLVLSKVYLYMISNQLHINMGKCCYMHFRPKTTFKSASRSRYSYSDFMPTLKINNQKIPHVHSTKFLGVVIDDRLSWEDHVSHLENKLKSCLVVIKRIMKYIPNSQYMNIYNSLFLSHLTYGISAWGGIPHYKLEKLFVIQKRCIRLLFGRKLSFDHGEYYKTCARSRTYQEHMSPHNFCLEHTKPLFTEHKLLTLHSLYYKHTFIEMFKIIKFREPRGLFEKILISSNDYNNRIILKPNITHNKLPATEQNFLFKSCKIWNTFAKDILEKNKINGSLGYIIPGEEANSDLSASVVFIKDRLTKILMGKQSSGLDEIWEKSHLEI